MSLETYLAEVRARAKAAQARADAATKGPWFRWTNSGDVSSEPEDCALFQHSGRISGTNGGLASCTQQAANDCDFVTSVRTDIVTANTDILKLLMIIGAFQCEQNPFDSDLHTELDRIAEAPCQPTTDA